MFLAIRRVSEPDEVFEPTRDGDYGAIMCEGFEAVFPVVGACARVPNAAEGCVGDAGVEHDVVDCYAAGLGVCEDWVWGVLVCGGFGDGGLRRK